MRLLPLADLAAAGLSAEQQMEALSLALAAIGQALAGGDVQLPLTGGCKLDRSGTVLVPVPDERGTA